MRRRALRIFRRAVVFWQLPLPRLPARKRRCLLAEILRNAEDSGSVASRGFCPNCGARLFAKFSANPTVIEIYAGSLDDPSIPNPQRMSTRPARSRGTTLIQSC
ncbi:MAG TPA: GFA family protein [Candidatus Binatia bacterium]|nr:GFA family protein [Candidatus Binatia bacterium]